MSYQDSVLFKKQWDQCLHINKNVWLPRGQCACLPLPAHGGDCTGTRLGFQLPTEQPGPLICDTAVRAPKTVSWLLDLRAGGLSWSPSTSSCAPSRAHNLTRDGEVMAGLAHQASWHDPRPLGYSVQRGQSAHSVRKHFSLLTDDHWAGWTQFLASHFPQLLQPSSWGFERRGRSTELITFKNYPHTVCSGNFKPQGHKLSKSQCDSSQIPGRWLLQEKARQIEPISSGLD